ncbi:MAG: Lrp/AsnC ligand binding domain-containing protein [SAR324 cluster bacterium]|nr:Lrp/AsnC ligand binding domain-containing protein [SAR324 cluster bacterium]
MITAVILLNVDRGQVNHVAQRIVNMENVTEVFSVSGRYDLVAIVRTKDNEGIADFVTNDLVSLSGIQSTETLLAFKAFSNFDLEHMFSIGS